MATTGAGRVAARVAADLLISAGLLLMLFSAYLLVWTNVTSDRSAATAASEVSALLESHEVVEPDSGEPFGLIYIPRLRQDIWGLPIVQGVGAEELSVGFGHYPQTPLPGRLGNAALAAHRATNGEPLRNVDGLRMGDLIHIRSSDGWSTYRLVRDEIVSPTDTWVIEASMTTQLQSTRVLTLTTCHPRWGSTHRWVWWATFESKQSGPPEGL